MSFAITLVVAATTAISAGTQVFVIPWLRRRGHYDVPGHRSSHSVPVPRGSGLGLMGALVGGTFVAEGARASTHAIAPLWPIITTSITMALIGLVEDFIGLRISRRLLGQALVAVVGASWLVMSNKAESLWIVLIALGLVGFVNVANFMDGVNGITGYYGVLAGFTYVLIGRHINNSSLTVAAALLLGICLGFLPWNSPRARAFLGDSGSYLVGALVCSLAATALLSGVEPELSLAPMTVYVSDVAWTIWRRSRNGERLTESHRTHVYQRLAAARGSHLLAAGSAFVATGFVIALTAMGADNGALARLLLDIGGVAVILGYLASPNLVGDSRRELEKGTERVD